MLLTVIVPCYNEEEALHFFYREMDKVMGEMQDVEFEMLFVNDGSRDKTLEQVKEMAGKDKRVKYVSFSRNFGKEAAIYAGLQYAGGIWCVLWMQICRIPLPCFRRCTG